MVPNVTPSAGRHEESFIEANPPSGNHFCFQFSPNDISIEEKGSTPSVFKVATMNPLAVAPGLRGPPRPPFLFPLASRESSPDPFLLPLLILALDGVFPGSLARVLR